MLKELKKAVQRMSFRLMFLLNVSIFISGCGGGDSTAITTTTTATSASTSVDVFDGAAVGCTVINGSSTAIEFGNGQYEFATALEVGSVVTATGCTDADTQSQLPEMSGVVQTGGAVVSPITTLIVAASTDTAAPGASKRTAARTISAAALQVAITKIVTNLGLGSYDPVNPATANYVAAAKADTAGDSVPATAMRIGLAIATLIKGVEIASGDVGSGPAVLAVADAIINSPVAVDLRSKVGVTTLMYAAATLDTSVTTIITRASKNIVSTVIKIARTNGPIGNAIAVTVAVSVVLNDSTAMTFSSGTTLDSLSSAVNNVTLPSPTPSTVDRTSLLLTSDVDCTAGGILV